MLHQYCCNHMFTKKIDTKCQLHLDSMKKLKATVYMCWFQFIFILFLNNEIQLTYILFHITLGEPKNISTFLILLLSCIDRVITKCLTSRRIRCLFFSVFFLLTKKSLFDNVTMEVMS